MMNIVLSTTLDIALWPNPTFNEVRERLVQGFLAGALDADTPVPAEYHEACSTIAETAERAAKHGRIHDLGWMPNTQIKAEAKAAAGAYAEGRLHHPHRQAYILFHRWEEGAGVYIVSPHVQKTAETFLAAELAPCLLRGERCLLIADRIKIKPEMTERGVEWTATLNPAPLRAMAGLPVDDEKELVCNIADPVITALALLDRRNK